MANQELEIRKQNGPPTHLGKQSHFFLFSMNASNMNSMFGSAVDFPKADHVVRLNVHLDPIKITSVIRKWIH